MLVIEEGEIMTVTIKDVAKHANVSIATVSRILNNTSVGYSEETKKMVMKAIQDLNYKPNAIARGLINKKTQSIGVLFPDVSSMLTSEVLYGIERAVHESGHSVIVCNTNSSNKKTLDYLQVLYENRVEGLIFVSSFLTEDYYKAIKAMDIPTVLVSTKSQKYPLPYVKVDDKDAAYTATSYLIEKGHRKIAMLSGNPKDPIAGRPRIDGFKAALEDHGLPYDDSILFASDHFFYEDGKEMFTRLMNKNPEVTAVFAASDEIAAGALSAAYQLKIQVPNDISIIGYDNLKIAEMAIPPLTTVEQPLREMGKKAAELLFESMTTGETGQSIIMPHKIIERESVKDNN